ncbi:putative amidoligase enzyme-domain-containing protein [Xylariaceae sp. FL1651]|nr:putative amidoligase enzyme-domain-containing protein [Xylariaceae sp. FL1651]
MAGYLSFRFGIEIELLLTSRSKNHKSWKSLASELSIRLDGAGIPNHLNESNDSSPENYVEWSITQEVTIPPQVGKNQWGLELVSPIYTPTDGWSTHLSLIFRVLKTYFTVTPSAHCSTHVHLSTSPPLQPVHLSSIAKAVLYFEPALDSLLPPDRATSYWCQSNRTNPVLKPLSLAQCFEYLDACAYPPQGAGTHDVVRAMCLFPARSAYGRAHGFTEDFVHGVYKWDFSGLILPHEGGQGKGTLEFRQAPGSRSAEDVRTWVELAVAFAAGAVDVSADGYVTDTGGVGLDPNKRVRMEDLWWILSVGAQSSGIGDLRGVEKLFVQTGKRGSK